MRRTLILCPFPLVAFAALAVAAQEPKAAPRGAEPDWRFARPFAGGGYVEVVGVSPHPSGPKTWWRPDGSPLPEAPCDPSPTKMSSTRDVVFRTVVVRVVGLPEGASFDWGIVDSSGGSSGPARRQRQPIPGLYEKVTQFPRGQLTCDVTANVAVGPWTTVGTHRGPGTSGQSRRDGPSVVFSRAVPTGSGTALFVSHDMKAGDVRVVAVDRRGKEHAPTSLGWIGVGGFAQVEAEFALKPEEVGEFRLQTRPTERLEIKDVALPLAVGPEK